MNLPKPKSSPLWRCLLVVACLMVMLQGSMHAMNTHSHYHTHVITDVNDKYSVVNQIRLVSKYERTGDIYFVTVSSKSSIYCLSLNGTVNLIGTVYDIVSAIDVNQTNGDIFLGVGSTVRRLVDIKTTEIVAGYEKSTIDYPNPTSPIVATTFSFGIVEDLLVVDSDIYVLNPSSGYKVNNGMLSTFIERGSMGYSLKGICKSAHNSSFYVTDISSAQLTQYNPQSKQKTVIAGQNGKMESKGDGGLAIDSSLNWPFDCAVTNDDEIIITETDGRIRKILSNNTIITIYKGGYIADTFVSPKGTILIASATTISALYVNGTFSTLLDISKAPYNIPSTFGNFQLVNNTIFAKDTSKSYTMHAISIVDGSRNTNIPYMTYDFSVSGKFIFTATGWYISKYKIFSNDLVGSISISPCYSNRVVVSSLNGDIYFVCQQNWSGYHSIFKIDKGVGTPFLVYGSLTEGIFKGENGSLASEARFGTIYNLIVAAVVQPDGSIMDELYVYSDGRIRQIRNNSIYTVAGTGFGTNLFQENILATNADLSEVPQLCVTKLGIIYFVEQSMIRKVENGIISTIAGSMKKNGLEDDSYATSGRMNTRAIVVDEYDNIYTSDEGKLIKLTMTCNSGYFGSNCELFTCFGLLMNSSNICSSHGECIDLNICECKSNYFGTTCNVTKCFDILSNETNACSGNGECILPDECKCKTGWAGASCSIPICFGKLANDSTVCSLKGKCTSNDKCVCNVGWVGQNCSIPTCINIPATDVNVCSSKGKCVGIDNCYCDENYFGANCDFKSITNYSSHFRYDQVQTIFSTLKPMSRAGGIHSAIYFDEATQKLYFSDYGKIFVVNAKGEINEFAGNFDSNSASKTLYGYPALLTTFHEIWGIGRLNNGALVVVQLSSDEPVSIIDPNTTIVSSLGPVAIGFHISPFNNDMYTFTSYNIFKVNAGNGEYSLILNNLFKSIWCVCTSKNGTIYVGDNDVLKSVNPITKTVSVVADSNVLQNSYIRKCAVSQNDDIYILTNAIIKINANGALMVFTTDSNPPLQDFTLLSDGSFYISSQDRYNFPGNYKGYVSKVFPNGTSTTVINKDYPPIPTAPIFFSLIVKNGIAVLCDPTGSTVSVSTNTGDVLDEFGLSQFSNVFSISYLDNKSKWVIASRTGLFVYDTVQSLKVNNKVFSSIGYSSSSGILYGTEYSTTLVQFSSDFTTYTAITGFSSGDSYGDGIPAIDTVFRTMNCMYVLSSSMSSDEVYLCDSFSIRKFKDGNITTVVGSFQKSTPTGPVCDNCYFSPSAIYVTKSGIIYFADGKKSLIYKVGKNGIPVVIAGNGNYGYNGDTDALSASLTVSSLYVDESSDTLYFIDHRQMLRKLTVGCTKGYYGNKCSEFNCFNIPMYKDDVCSGKGSCLRTDTCQCTPNSFGLNCEINKCFGELSNSSSVCSSHGSCVSANNCSCFENYFGERCELFKCYSYLNNDTQTCSGNGKCVNFNTCSCTKGYSGNECQYTTCFGINSNSNDVCSSRGSCKKIDSCECDNNNYFGNDCSLTTCFGVVNNDRNVCSSKGNCSNFNNCTCIEGWGGVNCSIPMCNGMLATDPKACGFGYKCKTPNVCVEKHYSNIVDTIYSVSQPLEIYGNYGELYFDESDQALFFSVGSKIFKYNSSGVQSLYAGSIAGTGGTVTPKVVVVGYRAELTAMSEVKKIYKMQNGDIAFGTDYGCFAIEKETSIVSSFGTELKRISLQSYSFYISPYSKDIFLLSIMSIYKLTNNTISLLAGTVEDKNYVDKLYIPSQFSLRKICSSKDGSIYYSDSFETKAYQLMKLDFKTRKVIIIAGNGTKGVGEDNIPATNSMLYFPFACYVNHLDEVLLTDNNRLRIIYTNGTISTLYTNTEYYNNVILNVISTLDGSIYLNSYRKIVKIQPNGNVIENFMGYQYQNQAKNFNSFLNIDQTFFISDTSDKIYINGSYISKFIKAELGYIYFVSATKIDSENILFQQYGGLIKFNTISQSAITIFNKVELLSYSSYFNRIFGVVGNNVVQLSSDFTTNSLYLETSSKIDCLFAFNEDFYICNQYSISKISNKTVSKIAGGSFDTIHWICINCTFRPTSIYVTSSETIYFTDQQYHLIYKIEKNGIPQVVAGMKTCGFNGDNYTALSTLICNPSTIYVDESTEIIYFLDNFNRIRRVKPFGCEAGWYGDDCDDTLCYGISNSNSSVCSKHGSCIAPDTCKCETSYDGALCDKPKCFGKSSLDENACSSHGECIISVNANQIILEQLVM